MKNLIHRSKEVGRGISMAAFASMLFFTAVPASAGIANTKHNLGLTQPTTPNVNRVTGTVAAGTATDEICVFCHTPHAASTVTDAPPLWNKNLPTTATYTTYSTTNSATIDGAVAPVGSISLACLSCHDGTQAMDNMVNAPGSGLGAGTGVNGLGYTWNTAGGRVSAEGMLLGVANLGEDLRNDHPIGIEYCGGGYTAGGSGSCKDPDFFAPATGTINGTTVYWVDTSIGTTNTREKTDMILYNRTFGANSGPAVECGSCHDPHVEQGAVGSNAGATFLRIANTGSAVCLACHNK